MDLLNRLQRIDRRILYLLMAAAISVPLLLRPSRHPDVVFPEVLRAYDTIDRVSSRKIVIVNNWWGPGTEAENDPQMEALMRHMFARGIKFAVMSWNPAGTEMTFRTGDRLQKELGKAYGRDWVHLGYKTGDFYVIISGMAENFPKVMDHDKFGTKVSKIPMLKGIRSYRDFGVIVEITPSGTVGAWISYVTTPKKIPLVYCPTAVMSAEAYPYLDSGQIAGMLNGVIGAAQYETLIGRENARTRAAATAWALSVAHILIITLIILGNLGYIATRRAAREQGGPRAG